MMTRSWIGSGWTGLIVVFLIPAARRDGFQLAVRNSSGIQAGALQSDDVRTIVSTVDSTGVQYAHHTPPGTALPAPDTARWTPHGRAPKSAQNVILNVAANAANDDASEFGDFTYTTQALSNASGGQE